MFLSNKTGRSGYDPERPVEPVHNFELSTPFTLTIVLLTRDMPCGAILRRGNPGPLIFRHDTVGLCLFFHLVDLSLLCVQPVCFSFIQLPTRNPLIDPLFLIRLPLIDPGCFVLGKGHAAHQYYCAQR